MTYKVDGWTNFCRVFELPETYPSGFCFEGGYQVSFQLVDWFYPVEGLLVPGVSKEIWIGQVGDIETKEVTLKEIEAYLIPFLREKTYMKSGRKYLILYSFGGSSVFEKE